MNYIKFSFFFFSLFVLFPFTYFSQTYNPDYNLKFGAEKLNNRGIINNSKSSLDGNEVIGEYDGNLQYHHNLFIGLPNGLDISYTLFYNANVEHRVFYDDSHHFKGGYMVNAPEWIIGVNGFAVQTFNFENNFYMPTIAQNLTGEQCPLLIPGYSFTERLVQYQPFGNSSGMYGYDYIEILLADGSKKILCNTRLYNSDTTNFNSRIGIYAEPGEGKSSYGYAVVDSITGTKLRKMWYKPGDGLTYYFEEEYVKYKKNDGSDKSVRTMYLKKIISSNGALIALGYTNQLSGLVTLSRGRKIFTGASYVYNQDYDGVLVLGKTFSNGYMEKFTMQTNKTTDYLLLDILNYNTSGSDFESTNRSSNSNHSKIKYIEKITDLEGRVNNLSYTIYSNRNYKWYNSEVVWNFNFNHPIYLLESINYYSNKTSIFEYYHYTFDENHPNFTPIDFSVSGYYGNGYNQGWAYRDSETNFMLRKRTLNNFYNGIDEPIKVEKYTYELIPHDAIYPDSNSTKNIITTIVTENKVTSDTSAPYTINRTLNFTEFKYQNFGGPFFGGPFQTYVISGHEERKHSATVKLIEETKTYGQNSLKTQYFYNIQPFANLNICQGSQEIIKKTEQFNNQPLKTTEYSYLTHSVYTTFGSKKIIKQTIVTDPTNNFQKTIYCTDFFNYSNSDVNAYFNASKVKVDSVYSGSLIKSYKTFDYYQTTPEGAGKLKWVKEIDPLNTSRIKKTDYFYKTENDIRYGSLKKISSDNGLIKNLYYPSIEDYGDPVDCYWVNNSDSILFFPNYHFFQFNFFNDYPYKFQNIFNSDTLTNYQAIELGPYENYTIDENGYVTLYDLDMVGRLKEVMRPGSFTQFPTEFEPPVSNNSQIYYYNDSLSYFIDTIRFNNSTGGITNLIRKSEFDGMGQLRRSYVKNNSGSFELKQEKKYNFLGLVSEETNGNGITKKYKYDFLSRLLEVRFDDTSSQNYEYINQGGTINGKTYYEKMKFTDEWVK